MVSLSIHTDKILNTISSINSHERDRASDAGEDRAEIGNLLELTGLNKKAFSFVRMLDKQEPEKREDILRSLHPLLDMMDSHWNGQGTADMFEDANEAEPAAPEAEDDFSRQLADVAE